MLRAGICNRVGFEYTLYMVFNAMQIRKLLHFANYSKNFNSYSLQNKVDTDKINR